VWSNSNAEVILSDSLVNLPEGTYFLQVEDANGCITTSSIDLDVSPAFEVEIELIANCEENTFIIEASIIEENGTNNGAYEFQWNTGENSSTVNNPIVGVGYFVWIINEDGCTFESDVIIIPDNFYSEFCNQKSLNGTLYLDQNNDCRYDSSELTIDFPQIQVALVKDSLLDSDLILLENDLGAYVEGIQYQEIRPFNRNGRYELFFNVQKPYTSDYQYLKISTNFPNNCNYRYIPIATLLEEDISLPNFDIPIQLDENCELLTVDVSTPFLRRCFESTYYINYCNRSAVEVENAYIEVQLDDFLDFMSSSLEATDLGGNLYRFDLGTLTEGECGQFPIKVNVSCDAVLGQTHCTSASIFPIPDCLNWSGAEIQITAECEVDSVLFTIENIGDTDMLNPSAYIAIEDVVAFSQGGFELGVQEKKELRFAKNGSTYRLRAQQVNGLPYPSQPTVALEGCGTNEVGDFSRGFVTQFSEDDAAIFTSIHCEENRGAYDPNDKQVFPRGVGALGQIEQNVNLEYKIRFQNTGTDTAFTVVILDTLDTRLDVSSVQAGASSHPYVFEIIDDRVLRFQFNDILLPDSTTNLAASQGFVQFRVAQEVDVPLGETILNNAAIYFDFNDPIITNQVSNFVGKDFLQIISSTANEPIPNFKVQVSPNPLEQLANIKIEGQLLTNAIFILYDFRGRKVRQQRIEGNKFQFYRKNLVSGGYFFKIVRHKDIIYTGKLVLVD
ncbi:MAG: T9SS type A sorting domain-containing protein, partial [Bacteroidota bacterium]